MDDRIRQHFATLADLIAGTAITGLDGAPVARAEAFGRIIELARTATAAGGKLMFIGNGGSAGIASHVAIDWSKTGGMRAVAFNDAAALTCLGNDYGYQAVFAKQIEFHGLPGDILVKVDRASMANSLELRAPLLDADFFAWAFSLPASEKLTRQRGGKAVFKKALESRLPNDLLYRPKQGFTLPLAEWLRGPLKADIEGLSTNPHLVESGVINLSQLQSLVRSHMSGAGDHSKAIWLVWVFTAFLAQNAAPNLKLAA